MSDALDTVEMDEFDLEIETLEKKLEERFPAPFLSILKKIANEVAAVGLTEKEACMICDLDYARFTALKQTEPLVRQLFERKNLEYKRTLLKPLSRRAQTDDKLAQWLLMSRFPEDFNAKRRGGEGDGEDMLGMAIEWVRKSPGAAPGLISESSGRSFIIKKGSGTTPSLNAHEIISKKSSLVERLEAQNL